MTSQLPRYVGRAAQIQPYKCGVSNGIRVKRKGAMLEHRAPSNRKAKGSSFMTEQRNIPVDMLRQLLRYEPETGKLFWLERPSEFFKPGNLGAEHYAAGWNAKFAGKEALTAQARGGYRRGNIFGRPYKAHRIAWALYHGSWPDGEIDHINGTPSDNRILNLRDVSSLENSRNLARKSNNTSGVCGVSWSKASMKWMAQITVKRKAVYLGVFDTREAAIDARLAANVKYGFSSRHGAASCNATSEAGR